MLQKDFVIFAGDGPWQIGMAERDSCSLLDVGLPSDASPSQIADHVAETLRQAGYVGQGLVLGDTFRLVPVRVHLAGPPAPKESASGHDLPAGGEAAFGR